MIEKIRDYIVENILNGEVEVTDDTPLYSSGLITSMGHLKLINYIERVFEISIPAGKINMDSFDTINQIVRFIQEEKE
jgi:acyl carrier protein